MRADLKKGIAACAVLVLAGGVAGCGTEYLRQEDTITSTAGDAVRRNIAIHTINPRPAYAYRNHIHVSGRRLEAAMGHYYEGGDVTGESDGLAEEGELQEPPPEPEQGPQ